MEYKIKENEMFLLPAKVPHTLPIRPEGSIGWLLKEKGKEHKRWIDVVFGYSQ